MKKKAYLIAGICAAVLILCIGIVIVILNMKTNPEAASSVPLESSGTQTQAPTSETQASRAPTVKKTSVPRSSAGVQTLHYKVVDNKQISMTFQPPAKKVYDKAPVYFIIPGGGWSECSRQSMIGFSAASVAELRSRGFAVVSIEYRVTGSGACMDDIVSDCMDAARYLTKYADVLDIDTQRIVTSGHSAGGHLALMMAYAPHELFVNDSVYQEYDFTVIGTAPISAPTILYPDENGRYLTGFTTGHLFACRIADSEEGRRGSPFTYIGDKTVPTLLIAGTADNLVFPESSTRFYEQCKSAGLPCELILSENGGHTLEAIDQDKPVTPDFQSTQASIVEFVDALVQ